MRSLQSTFSYFCVLLVLCVAFCPISAAEPTYWQDIRPVFRKHCIVCHSEKNLKDDDLSGRLALDSYEAALKGGKIRVVKPGDSAGSMLAGILRHSKKDRRMPKDAEPLPDETVALIKAWLDAGAKEGIRPAETATPTVAASRLRH